MCNNVLNRWMSKSYCFSSFQQPPYFFPFSRSHYNSVIIMVMYSTRAAFHPLFPICKDSREGVEKARGKIYGKILCMAGRENWGDLTCRAWECVTLLLLDSHPVIRLYYFLAWYSLKRCMTSIQYCDNSHVTAVGGWLWREIMAKVQVCASM